jgi:molecular chaperone DnaJ
MKDYYKILGLSSDCSQEDIKKAYRKLARRSHPDSCKKEDSAEFREVQEAYEAIGEQIQRNNYDRKRQTEQQGSRNIPTHIFHTSDAGFMRPFSFENYFAQILDRLLNDNFFHSSFGGFDDQLELILSHEEARTGRVIPVEIPIHQSCPSCYGSGRNLFFICDNCNGFGSIIQNRVINIEIPPNVAHLSQYNISIPGYGILNIIVKIR